MEHSSKICKSEESTPLFKTKCANPPKGERSVEKRVNGKESERNIKVEPEARSDMEVYEDNFCFENFLFIKGYLIIRAPKAIHKWRIAVTRSPFSDN
jgi:hypothetical protein